MRRNLVVSRTLRKELTHQPHSCAAMLQQLGHVAGSHEKRRIVRFAASAVCRGLHSCNMSAKFPELQKTQKGESALAGAKGGVRCDLIPAARRELRARNATSQRSVRHDHAHLHAITAFADVQEGFM